MKAFLWFVSLVLLLPLCCAAQTDDNVSQRQYNVGIQARGNNISGIALMEQAADGGIVGTIVNEFGVKVFDFMRTSGKTKLLNVIAPLNKWYIRRILKKDVGIILSSLYDTTSPAKIAKGKRIVEQENDGRLTLTNQRYKIVYTFSPMIETDEAQ